jgi:hypothetical protein
MKTKSKKKLPVSGSGRGGARPNSGRRPKIDKELWGKITCILKKETIQRLHTEGGEYFGEYLQYHLERYPLPSRAEYQMLMIGRRSLRGRRKMPIIISAGGTTTPKVSKGHRWPNNRPLDPKKLEAAVAAALE